jgi:hypothetical protein
MGQSVLNPLNAELNPICCLLALLGAHHFHHVSRIRVKVTEAQQAKFCNNYKNTKHNSCNTTNEMH